MNIPLSRRHGVNPHLTICPRCGKDGDAIVLSGSGHNYKCPCGINYYGPPDGGSCKNCGRAKYDMKDLGEPEPNEKFPMMCKPCEDEVAAIRAEINKGGVPFQCTACSSEGVIRAESEFAKLWSEAHPDKKVGIIFDGNNSPCCEKGVKKEMV